MLPLPFIETVALLIKVLVFDELDQVFPFKLNTIVFPLGTVTDSSLFTNNFTSDVFRAFTASCILGYYAPVFVICATAANVDAVIVVSL